jgi:GxxExxY protein
MFTAETRRRRKDRKMDASRINSLTEAIIGAAIEVRRQLGPGLLESANQRCLCDEPGLRKIRFETQRDLPVIYKGIRFDCGYRIDVLVEGVVVVEVKSVDGLHPIQDAQLITYLRLGQWPMGLIINFNATVLKDGIRRKVNKLPE